jgi:hypothetical protein
MEEVVKLEECMSAIVRWWRRIMEWINRRSSNSGSSNNCDDGALDDGALSLLPSPSLSLG